MIFENTKLLFNLFVHPIRTMGDIIDEGNWGYAAAAVAIVSLMLQFTIASQIYSKYEAVPFKIRYQPTTVEQPANGGAAESENEGYVHERTVIRRLPLPLIGNIGWLFFSFSTFSILSTVISLAILFVPITILVMIIFEPMGTFGVVLRRDYGPLLVCTLLSWAAAHLPVAIAGLLGKLSPGLDSLVLLLLLWLLAKAYFAVLMVFALRTVFGTSYGNAIGTICFSWISIFLESFLLVLASPFVIYFGYYFLRGEIADIGSIFRGRQGFKRNLEAATVNPRDAEANYQLGLIYQQRRQYGEAIERFKKAVEIDPNEIDAHFQLGRIAREQNRLQNAIDHFNTVVTLDEKHSQSEIWREIGETYMAAGMFEDAYSALERFIERRAYDSEGLYLLGTVAQKTGRPEKARESFERCIEASQTMPHYRYRSQMRKWRKLAQEQLKTDGNNDRAAL
jgi:tetratricopeptide (TPR) repeat protein